MRHAVRFVCSFVSLKLVALLKAHFEIVHPLLRFMLLNTSLVDVGAPRFAHAFFVLADIVQFVTAHCEVWPSVPVAIKDTTCVLFKFFDCLEFLLAFASGYEAILCRCFGHFKVLLRQVRLAKLI